MKSNVSYPKEMRDRAANEQSGLYTIDLINGSKKPGKLGTRMTMQGPVDAEEYKAISEFMIATMERRSGSKQKSSGCRITPEKSNG